jgi:hypothetical protein
MSISDQPSFDLQRKRLKDLESTAITDSERAEVKKLREEFQILSNLPDAFNRAFVERGWISHESLSLPSMKKALQIHKESGTDAAEKYLLEHYDDKILKAGITGLWGTEPFRARLHLIKLAYQDFTCGRYHGCIPLLLMMIDGVVADSGNNHGFFSEKSEVTSWDSIAGHTSGLNALKLIYYKSRSRTNKNKITLPYRNGILHGRDLNYNNREVATKCWVLLFIIRDVLAAQRDESNRKKKHLERVGELRKAGSQANFVATKLTNNDFSVATTD